MALLSQRLHTLLFLPTPLLTHSLQIVVAGVINGHVACKYIYVRLFRGTDLMHKRSFRSTGTWVLIAFCLWAIAWVIAESIPVFNNLLSLMVRGPVDVNMTG